MKPIIIYAGIDWLELGALDERSDLQREFQDVQVEDREGRTRWVRVEIVRPRDYVLRRCDFDEIQDLALECAA